MAKRQLIQMFDDLDGQAIDENGKTVSFGIDGKSYEIDLSAENAAKLHNAFAPFISHARQTSARSRHSSSGRI